MASVLAAEAAPEEASEEKLTEDDTDARPDRRGRFLLFGR